MIKRQWPTLEGRLKNPLKSTLEALKQLERVLELSSYAKKVKKKCEKA